MRITHIFETHVQADHVSGAQRLAVVTGAPVLVHTSAPVEFPHVDLEDGEEHEMGNVRITVLHTPGHTPDGVCLVVTDRTRGPEPWFVLTGDTLFAGGVGRPDLLGHGAETHLAEQLYDSLYGRLLTLPDHLEVFPAHFGGSACGKGLSGKPGSTIGFERRFNPALQFPRRPSSSASSSLTCRPNPRPSPSTAARISARRELTTAGPQGEPAPVLPARPAQRLRGWDGGPRADGAPAARRAGVRAHLEDRHHLVHRELRDHQGHHQPRRRPTLRSDRPKPILVTGWILALPVPFLIILAPAWWWIDLANVLLGANQAMAWSMTVIMKIDLVGPRRRGLALGLNEFAGYFAVGAMSWISGYIAAHSGLRQPFYLGMGIAIIGLLLSVLVIRETRGHVALEAPSAPLGPRPPGLGRIFWVTTPGT